MFKKRNYQYLKIKVIPRSLKNELVEIMDGPDGEKIYKIRVKAPPVNNKANQELLKFLARYFDVSASTIQIISGKNETVKLIKIENPHHD